MENGRIWLICACCALIETASHTATASAGNLLFNGGFENPVATADAKYVILTAGSTALTGWNVFGGTVETDNAAFVPPFQDAQPLDLDGASPGIIEQSIPTQIGSTYSLSFAYANSPYGVASGSSVPALGSVSVLTNGFSTILNQSLSHSTSSLANMDYDIFHATFVATSTTTQILFASTDAPTSVGGLELDAVSVTAGSGMCSLGDVNLDGKIDIADLGAFASHYGQSGVNLPGDINGDGKVDIADLGLLATNYGLGTTTPQLSFAAAEREVGLPNSIPEPTSLGLFAFAGFVGSRRRNPIVLLFHGRTDGEEITEEELAGQQHQQAQESRQEPTEEKEHGE